MIKLGILAAMAAVVLTALRKQTSVSYAADGDVITCYGGAKLTDKHLASTVHCVDDGIYRLVPHSLSVRRMSR